MSNNFNEYNCWDEWDEVDYGDTWDEYDNYTEWDEDDSPDHSDCYGYGVYSECRVEDSYDDSDIPPYVPGKQRLLDIATSHFQVDNYIFTYVIFDKSTNVMIAVTNQEEAFAKVTPVSAVEEINGEYYVDSAASVTFTEMERSIDRLRKKYSAAAEEDIQFISENKGTRVIYKGVYSFTYANQVICNSMAYAPLGATEYRHDYIKVQDLIEEETGAGYTVDYNPQTKETFARSKQGDLYYVSVAQDAVFCDDERYVYSSFDVQIQKLCTVSEWIMIHYNVAQADISVYSDRIVFTEEGGKTYKILVNDLPDYIVYDYDNYIPADATIEAVLDYKDVQSVPKNYYRVIAQIKSLTGLDATQDENNFIILCGKSFYIPNAVRFNGWIYAERKDVISALESNFVDIDNYFRSCGFYYGTDDNGHSYSASQYKAKSMWLLSKQLNITNRIRVNDTSGGNYFNLTTSTKNIEEAVESVFGKSASYLGAIAIESNTVKSYIEDKLYIRKERLSSNSTNLFINGKPYAISTLQTSFNSSTYYDKTKLLSAVKNLTPTISITKVETILNNGENYAYIAGNQAKITFTTSCLDHVAIGVQTDSETKWFHNTAPSSSMSMTVNLYKEGKCTLKVRGRTTIDPADVGLTSIPHSKDCEQTQVITVLHSIPNNMVYIIPYAQKQGCTVTDNNYNVVVKYQHRFYSGPETCTYYKSLSGEQAYKRQVSYTASGLYMNKETFRMDMDLDIINDSHNDRDWYLEKRIWRLWSQGKVASFSREQIDANGKKYFNVTMNGITRTIYKEPADNAFYAPLYKNTTRSTIRLVNNHLVMPESLMYILFSDLSDIETYILNHYKITNPSKNLKGQLNAMTLYDKKLNIDCITLDKKGDEVQLMATEDNTSYINHATVNDINSGMIEYRNRELKNVFDNLSKKRQELFHYNPVTNTVDFDGFEVDIPSLTLYTKENNLTQDDYKSYLFASESDIKKIDTYRRIVVYGAGMGGVCAAYKAAQYAWSLEGFDNFEIMLINPVPVPKLGGISTVGGQNFWDTRKWDAKRKFPYKGSLVDVMGFDNSTEEIKEDRYNVDKKAEFLKSLLTKYNVKIYEQHDISGPIKQDTGGNILSIRIRKIERATNNIVQYVGESITISGDIFIDASEDGKLTKLTAHDANGKVAYTKGRYDYPADTLNRLPKDKPDYGDFDEGTEEGARMPAVTLMFKLKCTDTVPIEALSMVDVGNGVYDCGNTLFNDSNYKMYQFNKKYEKTRIMLKPINSAWNGGIPDSDGKTEWWLNTLLIFGVDGSLHNRDDHNYTPVPDDELLSDKILNDENRLLSSDDAWKLGRAFLAAHASEILEVYEELGYTNAEFVTDNDDAIVTGDILYVRETIHAVKDANLIANGTENDNYEVSARHCHYSYLDDEQDSTTNPESIGLIYYWSDIHPYMKSEYKNDDGDYIHGTESYKNIRRDMVEELKDDSPIEPTYIPYSALTTQYVPNMLIPGYAVNASSFAWSEMRVFPNLCVLGDAAGIAAVTCLLSGDSAYGLKDISGVREILKRYNAIIDKKDI